MQEILCRSWRCSCHWRYYRRRHQSLSSSADFIVNVIHRLCHQSLSPGIVTFIVVITGHYHLYRLSPVIAIFIVVDTSHCHFHCRSHQSLSFSSSLSPVIVIFIIFVTSHCHFHRRCHQSLSFSSSLSPVIVIFIIFVTRHCHLQSLRHQSLSSSESSSALDLVCLSVFIMTSSICGRGLSLTSVGTPPLWSLYSRSACVKLNPPKANGPTS